MRLEQKVYKNRTHGAEGCVMGLDLNATVKINTCPKACGYEDMTM
jgi:hypothetical protein